MSQTSNDDLPPALLQQITTTLRPACPDIPDDEFARLVQDMARIKLKYDAIEDAKDARQAG
jgi:hypothetical protein